VQELHNVDSILNKLWEDRVQLGMLEWCLQNYQAEHVAEAVAEVVQQGAVLEQVMTENPFEVETIATESHMEIQKSNFRCSEEQEEITQVGMPEVQASPEQTAGLFKFSWFSTFEAERTFPGKIKKPCKKQRGVTYRCGYCSVKKMSTSTGKDGLVRIQCECGGKHQDSKPRLHARWHPT